MTQKPRKSMHESDLIGTQGRTALITGISGQDGAYLAALILRKGYRVVGTMRQVNAASTWRLRELGVVDHPKLRLVSLDVTDPGAVLALVENVRPDELYNFAAQSVVGRSFEAPGATAQVNGLGALNLLEAIRLVNQRIRYYQASSSEMFGDGGDSSQTEATPFQPTSPYGVSKLFAHWTAVNYRHAHGIFAVSGILFNHESPLRGMEFVTRKVSSAAAHRAMGGMEVLQMGNLDAVRDWGHAADYVEGVWLMMQADHPDTYVLATGRRFTVRDFVRTAFSVIGVSLEFAGRGTSEVAVDAHTGQVVVRVDSTLLRRADAGVRIGDASKAKTELGWEPRTTPELLCRMMVEADLRRAHLQAL